MSAATVSSDDLFCDGSVNPECSGGAVAGASPGRLARAAAPAVAAAGEVAAPLPWAGGTAPPRTKRKSSVLPQILACPGTRPGPGGPGGPGPGGG